uniref:CBF domain-containing protein n=1 Tax=Taenia asiatica TaxID=60517 RepID=A0A158R7Q4_TAEAS
MAETWFDDSYTQLRSESPEAVNISHYEAHARKIFDKYFAVSKGEALANNLFREGKDRVTQEWLSTVLRRGTGVDRVLALAFIVKENPLSSLQHIESLLAFVSPVKKQLCMKAIDVLSNLFENFLLPSKRALIAFGNRPFKVLAKHPVALTEELTLKDAHHGLRLPRECREHILALWYFEHMLKRCYFRFLTSLENVLKGDTIPVEKTKALSMRKIVHPNSCFLDALINLVTKKPENRELAISIVVNKLGDRSRGFASSVIHKLRIMCKYPLAYSPNKPNFAETSLGHLVLQSYPRLKAMLVERIRAFLFRPNLLDRAKYYAIVLLSSMPLSRKSSRLSTPMQDVATNDTAVAAVLFRIYLSFFRASVSSQELPERLTNALLSGISRVAPYLSVEVMSENVTDVDAIFRLVHVTTNFTISLQALNFLFHFVSHQQQLRDRYYQAIKQQTALYRKLTDCSIRWTARGPFVLTLLYQSLEADADAERRAALIQRLLSICLNHPNPGFVAGSLILLEKLYLASKVNPIGAAPGQSTELRKDSQGILPTSVGVVKQSHHSNTVAFDSDEENFSDVPASDEEGDEKDAVKTDEKKTPIQLTEGAWDHRRLFEKTKKRSFRTVVGYDSSARDPRFARALNQPCWHLSLLVNHAHPTVAYFARSLMERRVFKYTGDPFEDLSVAHFMERFVYKKPKPTSIAKPGKMVVDAGARKKVHAKTLAPNSLAYKNLNPEQVPSDERFIHSYFNFIDAQSGNDEGSHGSDGSDLDEDFDQYLRRHEKGLIPDDVDEDGLSDDSDFNYTTDEGEAEAGETKEESDATDSEGEKEESNGDPVSEDEDDIGDSDIDEDDFAPSKRGDKSGRLDLNKLFVSAEEIGDLYDNQEEPESPSSKRLKWKGKKRSQSVSRKMKRRHALFVQKRQKFRHKRGSVSSGAKKPRRR